jgi:hypothetical protein
MSALARWWSRLRQGDQEPVEPERDEACGEQQLSPECLAEMTMAAVGRSRRARLNLLAEIEARPDLAREMVLARDRAGRDE